MEGIVIKTTGSWHTVRTDAGEHVECKLKGKFKIKGIKTTNPVAVGDKVIFNYQQEKGVGLITHIHQRENYIIRRATKLSKVSHIIATNIDYAYVMATIAGPKTTTGFIDRFLVTTEAYHIPGRIIFNKIDLYSQQQKKELDEMINLYESVGYECFKVSAVTGENVEELKEELKDKINLISGHSGVGKSKLINLMEPGLNIKTATISSVHNKGKHTTTYPEMHPLSFGGFIIDTPGIKEFGLVEFRKEEIAERFPEFRTYMLDCRYNDCTHVHEPGCAVKAALERGEISQSRYNSYLRILQDDYLDREAWQWR
ncbi:MAG: ribosome small subunit-dependent GTPase A [Bacteroidales bacterium]|nr:ribosome small subunit-dependent GTPase A [Bacteroidales bacterium]